MTDRTCAACGEPEQRGQDAKGRPTVNLSPLTQLCVTCTVRAAVNRTSFPVEPEPFDARAAAAGKDAE